MSDFEIKEQASLPLAKVMELVLSGIQFRLFRAAITVAIIALAVAFLMTILGDSLIGRQVARSLETLTKPRRAYLFWARRLSREIEDIDLAETMLVTTPGDARWEEFKKWAACDDAALSSLKSVFVREEMYLEFFAGLKEGQLRRLTGRVRGRAVSALLQDAEARETFFQELPGIGEQMPGTTDEFNQFLEDWAASKPLQKRISEGHAKALLSVRELFGKKSRRQYMMALDEDRVAKINQFGFQMKDDEIEILRERSRAKEKSAKIERLLNNTVLKQRIANRYGVKDLNKVTTDFLFQKIQSKSDAKWLLGVQKEIGKPLSLSIAEVRSLASGKMSEKRLAKIESAVQALDQGKGFMGFSTRVLWLIGVSMVVCIVGIANAMLMSVTERFKEIATMKCLGAADGFIMVNFIMESGFQGFAGGVVGGLLGAILGTLRSSLSYGLMAVQNIPFSEIFVVFVLSMVAGIVLSVVAAIYPAMVAARLAPLEAMRVE